MDPNPLQYQTPDENQPLYRAGLLSAGFVAALIFIALGINFVIHHTGSSSPSAKRDFDTSPDDTVNGMRHELEGDSSGTTATSPMSYPTAGTLATNGDRPSFAPPASSSPGMPGAATPLLGQYGLTGMVRPTTQVGAQSQGMPPMEATAMRDWASATPENIADLIAGH